LHQGAVLEPVRIQVTAAETNRMIDYLRFIAMVYAGQAEAAAPNPKQQGQQQYQTELPVVHEIIFYCCFAIHEIIVIFPGQGADRHLHSGMPISAG
jgi:hypothetical protein